MLEVNHIHTMRCGHASGTDRELIEACMKIGAKKMLISDHGPFPDDCFHHQMRMKELDEYVSTWTDLKKEYASDIEIHLGLEMEYFPKYDQHYRYLNSIKELDAGLLLGQHMFFDGSRYSLDYTSDEWGKKECQGLGDAMVDGINSGYFSRVAHPDRIFRHRKPWDDLCARYSKQIIYSAMDRGMMLEKNISSMKMGVIRQEFWALVPTSAVTYIAADAHCLRDIMTLPNMVRRINEMI
ncbi:MAG: PHP domain-containing protein [Lachnospiraceae bacterium]|nr:PHP domain-containing protein [Candidatus Equihabitans merdae]